jgi:hypothetical protein
VIPSNPVFSRRFSIHAFARRPNFLRRTPHCRAYCAFVARGGEVEEKNCLAPRLRPIWVFGLLAARADDPVESKRRPSPPGRRICVAVPPLTLVRPKAAGRPARLLEKAHLRMRANDKSETPTETSPTPPNRSLDMPRPRPRLERRPHLIRNPMTTSRLGMRKQGSHHNQPHDL